MEKLTVIKSIAVPWLMPDVDTDVITPMRRVLFHADCLEIYSFEAFRFLNGDAQRGGLNPDFPLNQAKYRDARILIVGENFGCGSSRETAAEAIRRCGYRCLIGSSFGTIFYKNCFQQGILPIILPLKAVEGLAAQAEAGGEFIVSLLECSVQAPDGTKHAFALNAYRRHGLLEGLDDIGVTLLRREAIDAFYQRDRVRRPWLYADAQSKEGER